MEAQSLNIKVLSSLNLADVMIDTPVRCPEEVRKKIREAKLYLKLLTTIGSVEFIKWLPGAKTEGAFYVFDNFKIAKRTVGHREVVNLREVPGVVDAAMHCQKLVDMPQVAMITEAKRLGINWKNADALLSALAITLKGLSNVVSKHDASPGDIFRTDVATGKIADVDLIDLYMIQQHLSDRSLAIDMLCDMFHIPEGVGENIEIEMSRRWLYRRLPRELMYPGEQDQYEYVDFYENDLLLGRIAYRDNREIGPVTYWSKRPETPKKPLHLPFPTPSPLWNLNLIKSNPNSPVLLTASPLIAQRIDQFSEDTITHINDKISLIRARKAKSYVFCNGNSEFEEEVGKYVHQRVTAEVSKSQYLHEGQRKEILQNYVRTCYFPARNMFTARELFGDAEYFKQDGAWSIAYFECTDVYAPTAEGVIQNVRRRKNDSTLNKTSNTPLFVDYFRLCYEAITEFVNQKLEQDEREIAELEQQIKRLEERNLQFVISSWYGGVDTVPDVAWNVLKNRAVYLLLSCVCPEQLELGLILEARLMQEDIKLGFVAYENNEFRTISSDELSCLAEKNHIALPTRTEKTKTAKITSNQLKRFDINNPQRSSRAKSKYVVFPIIEEHTITLLYSQEGLGKTLVAMSIALAASSGTKVFGDSFANAWAAEKPVSVLYVDGEMSEDNFNDRLCNFADFYKNQCPNPDKSIQIKYKLLAGKGWDLSNNESQREQITKWVQEDGVQLLILDNLSTLTNFAETTKSWQNIFSWLKDLATHDCAVLLIHHAGKSGDQQRGSGAKTITVDNVIRLQHALGENAKRGVAINVQVEKGRNIPSEFKIPFNIMLKTEKKAQGDQAFKWVRTTSKAQGKEITAQERNAALYLASRSKAFNQQILADYFGLDVRQVKTILAQQEKLEQQRVEKTAQQIIDLFKIADTPTKRNQHKIFRMIAGALSGQAKEDEPQNMEDGNQEE